MKAVVLCIVALCFYFAAAQLEFSGDFEYRHPFMAGGVVRGTIQYSWNQRSYRLYFPTQDYQEIYTFNPARGYAPVSVTDRPFFNQWVYRSGRTCACETGPNDDAMAQLFILPSVQTNYTTTGATRTINGQQCTEYNKMAGTPGEISKLFWNAATSRVCRAVFTDLREITFTTVNMGAVQASVFVPPENCRCGQPVDLAIVLDRSGSISQTEFGNQKAFVVGFTNMFAYGPFGANLALVHFNTPAWTTLTMVEGINDANVKTSVNNLVCCTTSTNMAESCCCCGTSVSSGMRLGVDQLKLGRTRVEKVLVVVTDGYHNHDQFGNGCAESSAECRADLQAATAYAKAQIPDIKIYAVGVGADRDVSMDELLIVADQKPERVLRYTDFTSLAQNSLDLVARTCQENVNPCGGCCGFCVCGQCTAPDACDSTSFCSPSAVSGVCCKSAPRDCNNANDKCFDYTCDENQKACVSTPIACKANTTCFTYSCVASTGLCATNQLCGSVGECASDLQCDDGNACTTDKCNLATQLCEWTDRSATCNDNNACTVDECDVKTGCRNTPVAADFCNDQSVCTNDRCDPAVGCVHENITCTDDNLCTDDICDPFKGCLSTPVVCPNNGEDKCKLFFCLNGTCSSRDADGCAVPIIAAAAGLTTAAIIGIVVGIVLCVAGASAGGVYAASQAMGNGDVAPVQNNPIFKGQGNSGTNPLFKGGA